MVSFNDQIAKLCEEHPHYLKLLPYVGSYRIRDISKKNLIKIQKRCKSKDAYTMMIFIETLLKPAIIQLLSAQQQQIFHVDDHIGSILLLQLKSGQIEFSFESAHDVLKWLYTIGAYLVSYSVNTLNLSGVNISSADLDEINNIFEDVHTLEHINLSRIPNLNDYAVTRMRANHPDCWMNIIGMKRSDIVKMIDTCLLLHARKQIGNIMNMFRIIFVSPKLLKQKGSDCLKGVVDCYFEHGQSFHRKLTKDDISKLIMNSHLEYFKMHPHLFE